jgi:hypothetical protein
VWYSFQQPWERDLELSLRSVVLPSVDASYQLVEREGPLRFRVADLLDAKKVRINILFQVLVKCTSRIFIRGGHLVLRIGWKDVCWLIRDFQSRPMVSRALSAGRLP